MNPQAILANLNSEELIWQMPGFFTLKNLESKYLAANETGTKLFGFSTMEQISGMSDYDIRCPAVAFAGAGIQEDKNVILTKKPIRVLYIVRYADDKLYFLLGIKKPMITDDKVVAVIGQGIFLNKNICRYIINHILDIDKLNLQNKLGIYYVDHLMENPIKLSEKQKKCLIYLLRGQTSKTIAQKLNVSYRTVETHIDVLKCKFKCRTKAQLIDQAIDMGYYYLLTKDMFNLNVDESLPF